MKIYCIMQWAVAPDHDKAWKKGCQATESLNLHLIWVIFIETYQRVGFMNDAVTRRRSAMDLPNLPNMLIDINTQVASFRDMLIHIGHDKQDSPELRAQIRKTRRACVESCLKVSRLIMPQLKSDSEITATPILDNPHLILLFYLTQLFLRELVRSYHLIKIIPMNMSGYFDGSAVGPSNLGNVISQLLLCKQINPDFHSEELCSITKDSQEIAKLLSEMQEYMPKQEAFLERNEVLKDKNSGPWPAKRRRAALYRNMGLLCCISRQHPNYL